MLASRATAERAWRGPFLGRPVDDILPAPRAHGIRSPASSVGRSFTPTRPFPPKAFDVAFNGSR